MIDGGLDYVFDQEKNRRLKEERGINFEDAICNRG